jgi:hypothetical protein
MTTSLTLVKFKWAMWLSLRPSFCQNHQAASFAKLGEEKAKQIDCWLSRQKAKGNSTLWWTDLPNCCQTVSAQMLQLSFVTQ